MVSDSKNSDSWASQFRRNRMLEFGRRLSKLNASDLTVIDIGGTLDFWQSNLKYLPAGLVREIDVINLPPVSARELEVNGVLIRCYSGNALLPNEVRLQNYDIVHSNSVIEHVGNLSAQLKMARAIKDLGGNYWIQTPAKSFPLEPHFYFPFFAYLPLSLRAMLLRATNLGFHERTHGWLESRIVCDDTRLLNLKEFSGLFPEASIVKEKLLGMTKSYTATNL